jgi:hypothetical protein
MLAYSSSDQTHPMQFVLMKAGSLTLIPEWACSTYHIPHPNLSHVQA